MITDSASERPSICTARISLSMLDVIAILFCTRSIQAFRALPRREEIGPIAKTHPSQRRTLAPWTLVVVRDMIALEMERAITSGRIQASKIACH